LDARPANTEGDLDELKRAYYIDNYLQNSDGLTKDSDLKKSNTNVLFEREESNISATVMTGKTFTDGGRKTGTTFF
jgi:hypothetical protein